MCIFLQREIWAFRWFEKVHQILATVVHDDENTVTLDDQIYEFGGKQVIFHFCQLL